MDTVDYYKTIRQIVDWVSLMVGVIGFVGNFASIYILSLPSVGSRFSNLLTVLAYIDICYVTIDLVHISIKIWASADPLRGLDTFYSVFYPRFFHPWPQVFQTAMVLLTVIFSLDRYIAVFHPYLVYTGQGCFAAFIRGPKRKSMIVYLVCILVPSTIYSLPHFFEHKVMRDGNGMIMRDVQGKVIITQVFPQISKEFAFYYKLLYYTILETLVKLVIPLVILIYTNLSIYRLVNKENPFAITATVTTSEKRVFTLVAIVVLFLVCNTIKLAINSYDMAHYTQILACQAFNPDMNFGYSQKNLTVTRIGKFFLLLNSCSNFLIYVMCSPKFRRLLTKELTKMFRRRTMKETENMRESAARRVARTKSIDSMIF